jgi:glucosamine--fructose-6-phosphate aminotransferase (isomerizing)
MLKEIHEQPAALARTILEYVRDGAIDLESTGLGARRLAGLRRLTIVGCGTSYHAGLVGRYAIQEWAGIPVEIEIASEYRYRRAIVEPGDVVVGMTQSGETADTLAAMRLARREGAHVVAITNVAGSQATRDAHGTLVTAAGPEIGVAATKTFVSQVAATYLLGLGLAQARGALSTSRVAGLVDELRRIPAAVETALLRLRPQVAALAERWQGAGFFLYLGRHVGVPIALEGALKLKEVAYVATDAYPAGEMKHGPIALLDEHTPVICVATDSRVLDKTLSNIAEVRARGAHVIAIATEGSSHVCAHVVLWVPRTDWLLQALPAIVPLQLFAHDVALLRGLNVDQPRNLAKTVTVE